MEWKNCPFCGNNRIEVRISKAAKGLFKGSDFAFTSCYYCKSQGPNFYVTDMSEEESYAYAQKVWNERREISFSQEIKNLMKKP